jgi:glycosyltransferase involved in cell wall biosynthesis
MARFHRVWVLTHEKNRPSLSAALEPGPHSNLEFCYVDLPTLLRPMLRFQGTHQFYYYLWQIKTHFVAKNLHKNIAFDLFHHVTYANDWMASFIGALLPVPYVRGPGGGAHRTPKGFEKEYQLGGRIWEKVRSLGQWLFRRDPWFIKGQNRAKAILVCNQDSVSSMPSKWAQKVQMFPVNGVSETDSAPKIQTAAICAQFRVLTAGSLIRVKGFGLAIKAFKEFSDRNPNVGFSIIGSGPEEARLRGLARRLQIELKVRFVPAVSHEELLSQMAACDVFLFPSLRDGGGAVVIEAMSMGKPVVCLDAAGPGTHVTDECGIKITPRSPESAVHELAEALERLHTDEALRLNLGAAARQRAKEVYGWDRLGERLRDIYEEAVNHTKTANSG